MPEDWLIWHLNSDRVIIIFGYFNLNRPSFFKDFFPIFTRYLRYSLLIWLSSQIWCLKFSLNFNFTFPLTENSLLYGCCSWHRLKLKWGKDRFIWWLVVIYWTQQIHRLFRQKMVLPMRLVIRSRSSIQILDCRNKRRYILWCVDRLLIQMTRDFNRCFCGLSN